MSLANANGSAGGPPRVAVFVGRPCREPQGSPGEIWWQRRAPPRARPELIRQRAGEGGFSSTLRGGTRQQVCEGARVGGVEHARGQGETGGPASG